MESIPGRGSPPSSSRRRFLAGGAAWLGAPALLSLNAAQAKFRGRTISIFHTTDLHGHILPTVTYDGLGDVGGMARCITQIRQWRKESPDSLLLDVGDVYQGTPVGLQTEGRVMIDLFNRLGYDAWALGNHDFDWGREPLDRALELSRAPVLAGNLTVEGRATGTARGAWDKVKPWLIREVGGFRIGLVGLITPGLPYWLTPKALGGVAPVDPVETLRRAVAELRAEKADAIVVMGHMGWRFADDYANPVRALLEQVKGVDVFLAGHTHQDQPSWQTAGVLCTQANYYGIHCGRVDLTFDPESRKLLDRRAFTVLMDGRFELDPAVIETARPELAKADEQMARKVADFKKPLAGQGRGNEVWRMMCEAFAAALKRRSQPVDGIFHGTFNTGEIPAGPKTVADCWDWLPYENELIVGEFDAAELLTILNEDRQINRSDRELWPYQVVGEGKSVTAILQDGQPLPAGRRYRIALNSYDGQSGGRTLMKLRELLGRPECRRQETGVATREALIDYLLERA